MSVFHLNSLPKQKRIQMIAEFYDVINSLKDRNEVRAFFKDLLTGDEIATFMRRIEIAVLLSAGFNYEQISQLLKVSRTKITNVQKVLSKEGNGYKIAIERLLKDRKRRLKNQKKIEKIRMSEFERLKKRYPGHFLLFNLIDEISEKLGNDDSDLEKEAILSTPSFSPFGDLGGDDTIDKKTNKTNKKQ